MKYILNDNGEPQACDDIEQWANWFQGASRRVAVSTVRKGEDDYLVSTVFLGLDHGHFKGAPILWETMVFDGKNGILQDRCGGSREQAEAMHDNVCKKLVKQNRNLSSRIVHGV